MADKNAIRVLLQPEVAEEDVDDYATDAGWIPLGARPSTAATPYAYVWEVEDAGVQAEYVFDDLVGVAYLYFHGDDTVAVADQARGAIPTWSVDDVVTRLRSASDLETRVDSVLRIGVARVAQTEPVCAVLLSSADDPDAWMRRAFVTAAGYLEWPVLVERARKMRLDDPDPEVREEARIVVEAVERAKR
jgi:hypothetical protein